MVKRKLVEEIYNPAFSDGFLTLLKKVGNWGNFVPVVFLPFCPQKGGPGAGINRNVTFCLFSVPCM